jgi:hypothetical protein
MKKLFSLFISIIIISISIYGQTTFNKLELFLNSNNNSSEFFETIQEFNGYYYGTVDVFDSINQPYTCFLKLDDSGNVIAKKFLQYNQAIIIVYQNQTFINTSDSNLILSSNLRYDSTAHWVGYLIKLNTNLDTLWTKIYTMPPNLANCVTNAQVEMFFTAIKETPDKGFIIAGNYQRNCITTPINQRGFLLKVDSAGNVQWWKAYTNVTHLYDIELTDDGGYVILNSYLSNQFSKLDSVGNIQWQTMVDTYMGGWAVHGDITPSGNNEYIVVKTIENSIGKNGLHTYKINITNKQIIWDTTYNLYYDINSLSLHKIMGAEVNQNGEIIVWATAHVVEGKGKCGAILKLNSNGDSLWAKYYQNDSLELYDQFQLNDLIITDDGGFFGVGYRWAYNTGRVMAWLFKTDSNGVIGWEKTVPLNFTKLKSYPNPATDYVTINTGQPLIQESELMIYNSLGQIVKSLNLLKQQYEIEVDLQGFEIGLYFFELRTEKKVIGIGKFIKE